MLKLFVSLSKEDSTSAFLRLWERHHYMNYNYFAWKTTTKQKIKRQSWSFGASECDTPTEQARTRISLIWLGNSSWSHTALGLLGWPNLLVTRLKSILKDYEDMILNKFARYDKMLQDSERLTQNLQHHASF